jgi:hypothetical protein
MCLNNGEVEYRKGVKRKERRITEEEKRAKWKEWEEREQIDKIIIVYTV